MFGWRSKVRWDPVTAHVTMTGLLTALPYSSRGAGVGANCMSGTI